MPHIENNLDASAHSEPNYILTRSDEAKTISAELRTVTATLNGQRFDIEPTPWGTLFKPTRVTQGGISIDAYTESPISPKSKVLSTKVSMILIKPSRAVPHGGKLVRVCGSDKLWQVYFPPRPVDKGAKEVAGKEEKKAGTPSGKEKDEVIAGGKGKQEGKPVVGGKVRIERKVCVSDKGKAGKVKDSGKCQAHSEADKQPDKAKDKDEARWKLPGKFAHSFDNFLKSAEEMSDFANTFFDAYAAEVGPEITGDDVRVDFCSELADPSLRQLYPEEGDDFWDELWRLATRGGALQGTAASDWREGIKSKVATLSKVDKARASRSKQVSIKDDYQMALGQAICDSTFSSNIQRRCAAMLFSDPETRKIMSSVPDAEYDRLWSFVTRKGTLKGAPNDWRDGWGV